MQENKSGKDWSRYDEVYDRAYKKGYEDGAKDNRNENPWNVPEFKPKDHEGIRVIVSAFNWKTRRQAKKCGVNFVVLNGFFIKGGEGEGDDEDFEWADWTISDGACVYVGNKPEWIMWSEVMYWQPNALPEENMEKLRGGKK